MGVDVHLAPWPWPDRVQELLLKAAFLENGPAARAWEDALEILDFPALDGDSMWLLALAHRRAQDSGELSARIAGLARRTWYANHLLVDAIGQVVSALEDDRSLPLVLDDMAVALTCYPDLAARAIWQGALVVRTDERQRTLALLDRIGWTFAGRATDLLLAPARWVHLANPTGQRAAVLLLPRTFPRDGPQGQRLWEHPLDVVIGAGRMHALGTVQQLVRVCVEGMRWKGRPSAGWAADATALVRGGIEIDWQRIVCEARRHHVSLPVGMALTYVARTLDVRVPGDALAQLAEPAHRRRETFALRATRRRWGRFDEPSIAVAAFVRHGTGRAGVLRALGSFLVAWWDLDHLWQVPRQALVSTWRTLNRRSRDRAALRAR
jgi:hypothetical protein